MGAGRLPIEPLEFVRQTLKWYAGRDGEDHAEGNGRAQGAPRGDQASWAWASEQR